MVLNLLQALKHTSPEGKTSKSKVEVAGGVICYFQGQITKELHKRELNGIE